MTEAKQFEQYQAISKLYKEIVDAITTLELAQVKLFLVNLQKRIDAKQGIFREYKQVKDLLDSLKQAKGKVAFHFACAKGDLDIVRYLVDSIGVDVRVKDKQGNNSYFTAVQHGHLQLVKYFIEEIKFSPHESKEGEIVALHIAANQGHLDIMSYLIDKGADVEKISIYGKPINWAVGSGNAEAVELLLQRGTSPNGDNSASSVAPIIIAVDTNSKAIYDLLIQKGADIHTIDPNGYSILHLAAEKGELEIVKDLVGRGANCSLEVEGKTPLYLAFEHSKWEVVNFIKEKMPDHHIIETKWKEETEKVRLSKVEPDKQLAEQIKNSGNKFYAAKQYEQAKTEYFKALSYDEDNDVIHRNIAACYLALKDYERSLVHCKQAKVHDPKNIKTVYREAQAYTGLNNLVDAASSMWECCMIEPANKLFRAEFQKLVAEAKVEHNKGKKE